MKKNKIQKILLSILKVLYYIVIAFVCLFVAILIYYIISSQIHANDKDYKPGISVYTIVSPSMTPVIEVYDVIVNVKVSNPEDIEVGDIITFKSQAAVSEGMTITHRVIAKDRLPDGTYEYMTQGDNNPEPDSSYVTFDNVIGKEILIIPGLGKVQLLISNKKSWLFLLLIPISIYLIKEIYKLIDLVGLKKKVNKVIEEKEEEPQIDREKQEQLKQQLRKELFGSKEPTTPLIKSEEEQDGFLEKYSETIIKVDNDKYPELDDSPKKEVIAPSKPIEKNDKIQEENISVEIINNDEIILPKMKEYEVLETDDILKEKEYLEGAKIRVVSIEETKNKKRDKLITRKPKKSDSEDKIDLNSNSNIPQKNPNLKVERPECEDIKELRKQQIKNTPVAPPKKKQLKLNPNNVKKVNRNKKDNKNNKKLNLNPKNVKKVNRYKNQNNIPQNNKKKKRQRLIIIEKVK